MNMFMENGRGGEACGDLSSCLQQVNRHFIFALCMTHFASFKSECIASFVV